MSVSGLVMILLAIIIALFYLSFERSHPKAAELVLVAQLCALCICSRAIFSFVPYFNPVMALIMLSGVALGAKKGFLIGSLTAFGSNFIFGQGPWTLYQMVSWGLSGAIFGWLCLIGAIRRQDWRVKDYFFACFFAVVSVIFVTGPLADLSGVFMFGVNDVKSLFVLLSGGFLLNLALAASSVVTILLVSHSFLFALGRTVKKSVYGSI